MSTDSSSLPALLAVLESAQAAGERFLDAMVQGLAGLLDVRRVEVLESEPDDPSRVHTVAAWDGGPTTRQPLSPDRPPAGYLRAPLIGAAGLVLGWLALSDEQPLDPAREPQLVAQLFAGRAAAEIERRRAQAALREREQEERRRRAEQDSSVGAGPPAGNEELLAMLSHELRDPLAALGNAVDVLRVTAARDDHYLWAVEVLERQLRRMNGMVDDLLDVSQLAQGEMQLDLQSLDFKQVIGRAAATARPELEGRRLRLEVEAPPGPVTVWGDGDRLVQLLTALLDSAARTCAAEGAICLALSANGGEVVVRISAAEAVEGEGEAPSLRRRSDVGLTLVSRLVDLHGGSLAVGEQAGQGPGFVVRLPSPANGFPPARGPAGLAAAGGHICRRILVVDDHRDTARTLATLLELRGHRVWTVHSGRAVLDALESFRPEVVLLDIELPGIDGLEVARRIRARPEHQQLTLVAATGYATLEDRRNSFRAGFDHHLVKPLLPEQIEALLADGQKVA